MKNKNRYPVLCISISLKLIKKLLFTTIILDTKLKGMLFYIQINNNQSDIILDSYKNKHSNNRVHITFDHMFSHDNYVVFMFTMRLGTQGFPIYFECFKGSNNTEAFKFDTLKNGIKAIE